MRIDRLLFAFLLAPTIVSSAQGISIKLAERTPDYVTFTVRNTTNRDVSVCMSNTWGISQHRVPNGGFSPFEVQLFSRHRWHFVVGSDMADRFIYSMKPGESDSFSITSLETGSYRVVMDYSKGADVKTCEALESGHPQHAKSEAFTIP